MSLIVPSAFFEVCSCGDHGKIVVNSGKDSGPCCFSKETAHVAKDIAVAMGIISKEEALAVGEQIDDSPLPDDNTPQLGMIQNLHNEICHLDSDDDDLEEERVLH